MGYDDQFVAQKGSWAHAWQGMVDLIGSAPSANYVSLALASNTINDAFISRIWNPKEFTSSHAYVLNGTTPGGNFDLGVYTSAGDLIGSTGSVAQVGASQTQFVALELLVPRGEILLACVADATAFQYQHLNAPIASYRDGALAAWGWALAASSMPLPAALPTMEDVSATVLPPIFGVLKRWPL